jgi:TRAP-type C4-dicarboxylate transport system permease small subunit
MIGLLITILIYALVFGLLYWLITWIVATVPIPDPFGKIMIIAVVVIGVLMIIFLLLNLAGHGIDMPRLQ